MRKLLLLATLIAVGVAQGQTTQTFPQKSYYASDYGQWSILGQYPNTYLFSPPGVCKVTAPDENSFLPFKTNAPVLIRDAVIANSEVVTPTSVVATGSYCGFTGSTTHSHTSFSVFSGTAGLQEVLNQIAPTIPYGVQVILDRNWYSAISTVPGANAAAVIAAAKGSTAAILVDQTQAPTVYYRWNGTQYVVVTNASGSVTSIGLSLPNIFAVANSPVTSSGTIAATFNNQATNTVLAGPASGAAAAPLFRTLTAADINAVSALSNVITSGNVNGQHFPAQCGGVFPPIWCAGTTPDAWVRAACADIAAPGGQVNFLGLSGTWAASIAGCTSMTKHIDFVADNSQTLTITEADGGIPIPLDQGSSITGFGAGQCTTNAAGMHLSSSANVTAIVGPAHTDGTQENLSVKGMCVAGATGATVSKGLLYTKATFVNTTFEDNSASQCNNACLWLENVGGMVSIENNALNVTNGNYSINGSPIVLAFNGAAGNTLCDIDINKGNAEHANGGASYPEINFIGNGTGSLACAVNIHDMYVERNTAGTPDVTGINLVDCNNCSVNNVNGGGGAGGTNFISVSESGLGRLNNVSFSNIAAGPWTNTLNDSTPGGTIVPGIVSTYIAQPGYQQAPSLPTTTTNFLGADAMGYLGNFATGSGTIGTGFATAGCQSPVTCTYTRTNATAPTNLVYSQQIQVSANTTSGYNGVEYSTAVSFTAGQTYQASFWGKSDGTFNGTATFILGNFVTPVIYCLQSAPAALTTTWTLYEFTCRPSTSGSSYLTAAALTALNSTGTFYLAGFQFAQVTPINTGQLLMGVGPYAAGPSHLDDGLTTAATVTSTEGLVAPSLTTDGTGPGHITLGPYSAAGTAIPTCNSTNVNTQAVVSDATTVTFFAAYASGGSNNAPVFCQYNGSAYKWVVY